MYRSAMLRCVRSLGIISVNSCSAYRASGHLLITNSSMNPCFPATVPDLKFAKIKRRSNRYWNIACCTCYHFPPQFPSLFHFPLPTTVQIVQQNLKHSSAFNQTENRSSAKAPSALLGPVSAISIDLVTLPRCSLLVESHI